MTTHRYRSRGFAVLIAASLGGCATVPGNAAYNPAQKFAQAAHTQRATLTGSRIPRAMNVKDPATAPLSPTFIISRSDILERGTTDLQQALKYYVPNMVGREL